MDNKFVLITKWKIAARECLLTPSSNTLYLLKEEDGWKVLVYVTAYDEEYKSIIFHYVNSDGTLQDWKRREYAELYELPQGYNYQPHIKIISC